MELTNTLAPAAETATVQTLSFEDAVQNFLTKLKERQDEHTAKQAYKEDVTFEIMEGVKYIRVVRVTNQRCSYCFLDRQGNIYKCDGWKKPAKHVRGSIYNDNPLTGTGLYGAEYLR